MDMTQLAPNLFAGGQIARDDLEFLARKGFTDVVCNRPDAEHPEDPGFQAMAAFASDLGLSFHYLPIVPGEPFEEQARGLSRLVLRQGSKVFAYCRSGARTTSSWALAQAEMANGIPSPD